VIILVIQLLLGGAFIWAAATGFSFLRGGDHHHVVAKPHHP
jgi:hypothetical protein